MDFKLFWIVFSTVFLAELGDKTQIATLLFASDADNPRLTVLIASASALILTSAIGVLAGALVAEKLDPRLLSWGAGLAFIAIGIWTILRA
jgi:putative Ca2+/H+ antiporter (TMEM165/GDT1 family)